MKKRRKEKKKRDEIKISFARAKSICLKRNGGIVAFIWLVVVLNIFIKRSQYVPILITMVNQCATCYAMRNEKRVSRISLSDRRFMKFGGKKKGLFTSDQQCRHVYTTYIYTYIFILGVFPANITLIIIFPIVARIQQNFRFPVCQISPTH